MFKYRQGQFQVLAEGREPSPVASLWLGPHCFCQGQQRWSTCQWEASKGLFLWRRSNLRRSVIEICFWFITVLYTCIVHHIVYDSSILRCSCFAVWQVECLFGVVAALSWFIFFDAALPWGFLLRVSCRKSCHTREENLFFWCLRVGRLCRNVFLGTWEPVLC